MTAAMDIPLVTVIAPSVHTGDSGLNCAIFWRQVGEICQQIQSILMPCNALSSAMPARVAWMSLDAATLEP